jgi:hypothetical protein
MLMLVHRMRAAVACAVPALLALAGPPRTPVFAGLTLASPSAVATTPALRGPLQVRVGKGIFSKSHLQRRVLPARFDPVVMRKAAHAKFASIPSFSLVNGHFVANEAAGPIVAAHPTFLTRKVLFTAGLVRMAPQPSVMHVAAAATAAPRPTPVPNSVDFGVPVVTGIGLPSPGLEGPSPTLAQGYAIEQGYSILVYGKNLGGISHVTATPYGTLAFATIGGGCSITHLAPTSFFAADGSEMEIDIPTDPWLSNNFENPLTIQLIGPGGSTYLPPLPWDALRVETVGNTGFIGTTGYPNDVEGLGFTYDTNTFISQTWSVGLASQTGPVEPLLTDKFGVNVHLINGTYLKSVQFKVNYPNPQAWPQLDPKIVTEPPLNQTSVPLTTIVQVGGAPLGYHDPQWTYPVTFAVGQPELIYDYITPMGEPPTDAFPEPAC